MIVCEVDQVIIVETPEISLLDYHWEKQKLFNNSFKHGQPDAPIFNYAHYAMNTDCVEFLQTMIEMVKENGI